jgi:branched-chain amino acid aminotransferase
MGILQVLIDGQTKHGADASISVADEGLLRGDGVFEVLRSYSGTVFALDQHIERMERSAAGLRLPFDSEAARQDVRTLAADAGGRDAVLRLIVTRGGRRISLLETLPAMPKAVRLATIPFSPTGLLDGLKTLSYAGNGLATRLAVERGADQALLVRPDGKVFEGPNFAVFVGFHSKGPLVTPPLSSGILDSITRRQLMDLVPVIEQDVTISELKQAQEAFVASTLREVLPVSAIDRIPLNPLPGALTVAARDAFRGRIANEVALATGVPAEIGGPQ